MTFRGLAPLAAALVSAVVLSAAPTAAQVGFGQPGQVPPKPPPGTPPTHAASGAEDSQQKLPSTEPSLPADPLALPPSVASRIGSDADTDVARGLGTKTERSFYGLYYSEQSGSYRFRTLFPLWAERTMPNDRASLFGLVYFNRRSTEMDADVLFPLFWKLRDGPTYTTVVGPWMHRERESAPAAPGRAAVVGRHDNWLAPLWFEGGSDDGSGYFHVPPLLTFTQHTARSGFNLVGPLFCKWKGGPACDARSADEIDMGLAPFYFYGRDDRSEYELIPPLLHYYHYSDVGDSSFDLWGPVLKEHSRDGEVFNIMPLYWHNWGKNEDHTTVFPLFHYGYEGAAKLLITPLFLWARGQEGESTVVTWGYARYRGRTELDMWTPLFWQYRDPDIGLDQKLLFPLFFKRTSPRNDDIVFFPLFGRFEKPAIERTTWITPLFRHTTGLTGWETRLYPVFYAGRENRSTHLIVAPFLWDFASPKSRATVVLPAYWRFADETSVSLLAGNTYYHEKKVPGGSEWEVHFFPAFSYGESPNGHWWNFLYGLVGYTREGTMSKMRALYIPITLSD